VKEVRESKLDPESEIDAYGHIRGDTQNFRKNSVVARCNKVGCT
jgi:hypothetical protein